MTTPQKSRSDLAAVMLLCIDIADSLDALARWWRDHNRFAHLLPEVEKARVIAAKDRRKEELT